MLKEKIVKNLNSRNVLTKSQEWNLILDKKSFNNEGTKLKRGQLSSEETKAAA